MATELQTQTGRCPAHGTVEATREIPKLAFPYVYFAIMRSIAQRRPYRCPQYGAAVEAT
jgi:hypothetical protein